MGGHVFPGAKAALKKSKVMPGGNGNEFFGYTAYSGGGFLNTIERV
mgnify:FL=1